MAGNVPVDRDGNVDAWLLGPFSLLYFDDFNFDGRQDLAIRNGSDPEMKNFAAIGDNAELDVGYGLMGIYVKQR
jgi:hypothetical protein